MLVVFLYFRIIEDDLYRSLIFFTYAKQARAIVNLARVNEDPKARMIRGKNRIF